VKKLIAASAAALVAPAAALAHPVEPDWSDSLKLEVTPESGEQRSWSGWRTRGPIAWIARHGLRPTSTAGLAWRGRVERGRSGIRRVARSMTLNFNRQPVYTYAGKVVPEAVSHAIHDHFGRYTRQAIAVSFCESGWRTKALNGGGYAGIFQMGRSERGRYGHGASARAQARAASRYFFASGADWSPWVCQP